MAASMGRSTNISGVKTSFQKKGKTKSNQFKGTRPSLHNNLLLVSSGVPSFDYVLGGGLTVGSVLLIEEDSNGYYANLLLRYFLAEGVMGGHELSLASADQNPENILKMLPYPIDGDQVLPGEARGSAPTSRGTAEPMKIAWRYESLPKVQGGTTSHKFGHNFDLRRAMSPEHLSRVPTTTFHLPKEMEDATGFHSFLCPSHQRLLSKIEATIGDGGFHLEQEAQSKQGADRTILRIALHSLGSPLWWDEGFSDEVDAFTSLCRFFHALRALLRNSLAVAVVTMPVHLLQEYADVQMLERLCDAVVQVESFAGSDKETNPIFEEYQGLLHIKQLPRLNSLTVATPDSADLGFKLKRKKFTIEKLHLPPEFSDSASRPQEDGLLPSSGAGCSSMLQKGNLDF